MKLRWIYSLSFCFLLSSFTFSSSLHSQTDSLSLAWIAKYADADSNCQGMFLSLDKSGNIYVVGRSYSLSTSDDIFTIKYNSDGVVQWANRYNGSGDSTDYPMSSKLDQYGNVYIAGYTYNQGNEEDFLIIKYNSDGGEEWINQLNGPENGRDIAYSIAIDDSNNVFVTGYNTGSDKIPNCVTIKYDSQGILQWINRINDGQFVFSVDSATDETISDTLRIGRSFGISIAVGLEGNVYVAGIVYDSLKANRDFLILNYSRKGKLKWIKQTHTGWGDDTASFVVHDSSQFIYVAGHYTSIYSRDWGYGVCGVLVQYDSSGNLCWRKKITDMCGGLNEYGKVTELEIDSQGNLYIVVTTDVAAVDHHMLYRMDAGSGEIVWKEYFDPYGAYYTSRVYDMKIDNQDNVYVLGSSLNQVKPYKNYTIVKFGSSGNRIWKITNNLIDEQYFEKGKFKNIAFQIDDSENIYVIGRYKYSSSKFTTWIFKYSENNISIDNPLNPLPEKYMLNQNYPNPFNPVTTIEYQLSMSSDVSLAIYNITGQLIETLVNTRQEAGTHDVQWKAKDASSGIYLYKLTAGDYTEVRKCMLLR